MGQTFFRSGSGDGDTYALFTAGGTLTQHRHFDANSFVIFKRGFLALDSGTRPQPGQHLSHYYSRTVAHNAILIHMPGELDAFLLGRRPRPRRRETAVPQRRRPAFRRPARRSWPSRRGPTTPTWQATPPPPTIPISASSRSASSCSSRPITSSSSIASIPPIRKPGCCTRPRSPPSAGASFTAAHEQGRLACRTLLPEKAKLEKIGGPGRQFWSGGRNWPLPKDYAYPGTTPLFGQWRVEVATDGAFFLHVLDAAGRPIAATLVRREKQIGARVRTGAGEWEVLFGTEGPPSAQVRPAP